MFLTLIVVRFWKSFPLIKGLFQTQNSFWRAFIYSSVSVLEDWPWLTKSFLPVFLRLPTCRCMCNFTHLNCSNKSVGIFTVPLLMWLKAGRIRALTFHNLAKGSYESELVSIRKNTNTLKSQLWYIQRSLWSHNINQKSWGMPLDCFGLICFIPQRNEGTCDLQSCVTFGFSWMLHFTCTCSMWLLISRNRVHT